MSTPLDSIPEGPLDTLEMERILTAEALDFVYYGHISNDYFYTWLDWVVNPYTNHTWVKAFGYTWKIPPYLTNHNPHDYHDAEEWAGICYFPHNWETNHVGGELVKEAQAYWREERAKWKDGLAVE